MANSCQKPEGIAEKSIISTHLKETRTCAHTHKSFFYSARQGNRIRVFGYGWVWKACLDTMPANMEKCAYPTLWTAF